MHNRARTLSVREGTLDNIRLGSETVFEDIDEKWILKSCTGLENFVRIDWHGIPMIVFDNHHYALYFWYEALSQERLEKKVIEKKDGKYEESEPSLMPDPSVMNVFMLWGMPAMIAISTYFFPAGVGIYWLIGTLFMLAQQAVVNKIAITKETKKDSKKVIN